MHTRFLSTLLLAAVAICDAAAYQIKAVVADSQGEPLPYVTYRLFTEGATSASISQITNELGVIKQDIDTVGTYRMNLSYVGMNEVDTTFTISDEAPVVDLGTLVMSESAETLEAITVTAQKPMVIRKIDGVAFDLTADPERPTLMVSDVLRKVPMVSVDADGTIRVNGSTDFKIYKNGRPAPSLTRNSKDIFRAMPASTIKRIEVITEPGAEYDAEGTTAVLNFITEDNSAIKGYTATAMVNYDTENDYPSGGIFGTGEVGKVTVSLDAWYQPLSGKTQRSFSEETINYSNGDRRFEGGENSSEGYALSFGGEASWQPDTLNLFTFEAHGWAYDVDANGTGYQNYYAPDGTLIGGLRQSLEAPFYRYFDAEFGLNYQHSTGRPGEKLTASYLHSTTNQSRRSQNTYEDSWGALEVPYNGIYNDYDGKFAEHTLQFDWVRVMGIHTIDLGAKGIFRHNTSDNTTQFTGLSDLATTQFQHDSYINGAYAQYSANVGKFMLRGGVRYENTYYKAEYPDGSAESFSAHLNDLVPSAAISYQASAASSFRFNYSSSISRPGISYLNPAYTYSPTAESHGNPDLSSARRHSLRLTYTLYTPKFNMNANIGYSLVNNGVAAVQWVDENNYTHSTYGNVSHYRDLSLQLFAQWSITDKSSIMVNGSYGLQRYKYHGMVNQTWAFNNLYMRFQQKLPWKINAEIFGFYRGNTASDVYTRQVGSFADRLYYGIQISRNFLKEDRLQLRLGVNNPIGSSRYCWSSETVNGDYTGYNSSYIDGRRSFNIAISYRLGSLKSSVKKVDNGITNDDLEGRKQ